MKGIYFINERLPVQSLTLTESITLQIDSIGTYIKEHNIDIIKLNPYQIYDYYTNPHALLFDVKKQREQLDCLLYYSLRSLEDFIYHYPAKWLILKSFFKEVIEVENHIDRNVQKVV
ncbi:hypothetical protein [Bacillus rubiinfantis]|uniref:hypothetical protein n=1 Tax=Bacillus rubiinfantis TaxID=1499680 RepID=UPI0005A72D7B|nr:hypothetical protein [Bacillus rubiinfantis]